MSHSTPEQPTFGEYDESDALPSDAIAAAELHGDARNDDQVAIFDAPVLDGGVRYASSVFCPVCFETQGNV